MENKFKIEITENDKEVIVKFTIGVQTFSLYPIFKSNDVYEGESLDSAKFYAKVLEKAFKRLTE